MKITVPGLFVAALVLCGSSLLAQVPSQSLFSSQAPALVNESDDVNYELGMSFQSAAAGQITAVRFWKDSDETGVHTGNIWSASGQLLASTTFTNESASGWQQQNLAVPLSIAANTPYVVSVNTANMYYVDTIEGLASQIVNGNLSSIVGNNALFGPAGQFPANSWNQSNYFRDVVFSPAESLFTRQAPALTGNSDGADANYELGMLFQSDVSGQLTAIRFWKDADETGPHTGNIWSASGELLASVTFASETSSGWQQQSLPAPLPITANTIYVVSVNTGNTYYVDTVNGLASPIVNQDLTSIVGNNAVYGPAGQFPTNSWNQSNYFRDVVFSIGQPSTSFMISGVVSPAAAADGTTLSLSGATTATITASNSGSYTFTGVADGVYAVTPTNADYQFIPSVQAVTVNGANVTVPPFTASGAAIPTYSISGTITSSTNGSGANATVTLSGAASASTVADSTGAYVFSGLPSGAYTVTPGSTGAVFAPASQSVSIGGANSSGVNFTAAALVFYDDFTTSALSSDWTIISRHGEYAQDETECNVPGMVSVANSLLTITTEAQTATCGDFNIDGSVRHTPSSWPYITGDVQWTSLNFTYGTITIRAQFPSSATGLWPATWLLGSNCQVTNIYTADTGYSTCAALGNSAYTEIDMTECYNSGGWCQFHVANPNFNIGNGCDAKYSVDTNFHIFTTVWTAASIKQYLDGALVTTCNQTLTNPMFLIIQTQTGGVGGTPNNNNLPANFNIDYIQVTQP